MASRGESGPARYQRRLADPGHRKAEDSIVVFGSGGGGALFALSTSGRGVYRMVDRSFIARGAPYERGDVTVVAPEIGRFLDFLCAELRAGPAG